MKSFLPFILVLVLFAGCKKESNGSRIEIYLLKSFTTTVDQSSTPPTVSIANATLEDEPFVTDQDIRLYNKATHTFELRKNIYGVIQNYGSDKAFAVTIDGEPVYYGKFHPLYMSSILFGVATIAPLNLNDNDLKIDFATITGSNSLLQLDKRNDSRIIDAMKASGRLR